MTAQIIDVSPWTLAGEGELRSGQVNTLTAIRHGHRVAAEHNIALPNVDLDCARKLAERAHRELERRRSGGEMFSAASSSSTASHTPRDGANNTMT
ncbi:hypothetical protein [Paeniglutamicibacter kerguelensis]|uniref:hypothetical protein n=1 Tax=Paeniglutamicibacter kerguelensis TaxID=254788 RepID=UPI003606582F